MSDTEEVVDEVEYVLFSVLLFYKKRWLFIISSDEMPFPPQTAVLFWREEEGKNFAPLCVFACA